MLRRLVPAVFFALLLTAAGAARALDFASVGEPYAVLYDAPSLKAKKLYVATRYMPVEVVVTLSDWAKVRDQSGAMAWVQKSALSSKRYVVVVTPLADVRQKPDAAAPLVFQARQKVALEYLERTGSGWIKVRHQDGATGYIKITDVWGD